MPGKQTQLWIVRHGATEWSENGRYTSVTDLDLLPQGTKDAEVVGSQLAGESFGLVLSSPRLRARKTAEIAGFLEPDIDDDLVEWSYGPAEGLTSDQIRERVDGWRIWTHGAPGFERDDLDPDDIAPGESVADVSARLTRVVERVRASGVAKVLAFGHGHAMRSLAMVWLGFPIEQGAHFPLQTGAISVLGWEKDSPAIVRWNS